MIKRAKVLILDIETSPILAYVWELKEQNIGVSQIYRDWYIMAWSAKWLEEPDSSIVYYDNRKAKNGDDSALLRPLWKLLNEAEIVITQNGKEFDAKKINARFMLNGMPPTKPFRHYDTYQLVRSVAGFTSNGLEYLTSKFCKKHKKASHSKYPGWSLWVECLKDNQDAWNEMKKYNIKDVLSTEELYLNIRSWAPERFPKVFDFTDAALQCGTCGHEGRMIEGKLRGPKGRRYRQHQCPKCGSWQKGLKVMETKNDGRS